MALKSEKADGAVQNEKNAYCFHFNADKITVLFIFHTTNEGLK